MDLVDGVVSYFVVALRFWVVVIFFGVGTGIQVGAVPGWVRVAREAHQACVVLATGDPLCHGIAPYLAQHLCLDALEILPNLSTLQLACARVGLAWQDARIVSVHAADAGEWQRGAPPSHGLYALAQALRLEAEARRNQGASTRQERPRPLKAAAPTA